VPLPLPYLSPYSPNPNGPKGPHAFIFLRGIFDKSTHPPFNCGSKALKSCQWSLLLFLTIIFSTVFSISVLPSDAKFLEKLRQRFFLFSSLELARRILYGNFLPCTFHFSLQEWFLEVKELLQGQSPDWWSKSGLLLECFEGGFGNMLEVGGLLVSP
jgi:hypothetical protein